MPAMSADDRARRTADLAPMITTTPTYVSVWRSARDARKQTGPTEIASDIPIRLYPASDDAAPELLRAIPTVGGARVDAVAFAPIAADIQHGDELQTGSERYKVIGRAAWLASAGLALSELVNR